MSETRRSTCSRDCPDTCGLEATLENGVMTGLRGDSRHPVTRGFLCFRTSHFPQLANSEARIRQAHIRRKGQLVPVTLDEALDVVGDRLSTIRDEDGAASIFHYRSGGSLGILKAVADRFFELFGPCTAKSGDICNGAGEAAQLLDLGVSDSNDLFDLCRSKTIILWGKNPHTSNVHLIPLLKDCREAGASLWLIDPVQHKGTTLVDDYVQPRPGGDLALALGIGRVLLDRGDLQPADLARCDDVEGYRDLLLQRTPDEYARDADVNPAVLDALADAFCSGPTAILVGWGMQRRSHGAAIVRALDALSAVTGNLFRPGGGCSFYFSRRSPFDNASLSTGAAARRIPEPLFGEGVLAASNPPIRAIWVTAANPVCMLPDAARVAEAIEKTEFVVVVDPLWTDTARRADVVLPVPTLFEDSDLLGSYGHHYIAESRPLVEPPEGVVHEVELFQQLAQRLGLADEMAGSVDDYKRRLLSRLETKGVTLDRLREGAVKNPFVEEHLFPDGRVQTETGRVQLLTEIPTEPIADKDYPLWLMSNSTEKSQASQWSRDPGELARVTVHPAAVPGFAQGDEVLIESAVGSIPAQLVFDEDQRPDLAIIPKGGHFDRKQSANALIQAVPSDLGLGAAYLDQHVRILRP